MFFWHSTPSPFGLLCPLGAPCQGEGVYETGTLNDMDKKQNLQHTFDSVAQGYDHPALSFFPETAKRLVEHLETEQTVKMLDVCTGTGVVALRAASQIPQATITGIDLSPGMLEQAQTKADQQQLNNINFFQMDLDHLDFPDQSFDIATCSFGLFFLEDMEHGLRNIVSKVKPGGKIALSTFSEGAFDPMSSLFLERYEAFGYESPPLSWKQMTSDEQLTEIFSKVGIDKLEIHREPLGFYLNSADDWWDVVWNAGYRGLLNQMTEDEQVRFKTEHLQEIQQLCDEQCNKTGNEEKVWLDTGVAIVVARK